ncbi:MAG: efflux RND transporter periplasmic adaptor subunit [Gammaproteobacteria bacterium]
MPRKKNFVPFLGIGALVVAVAAVVVYAKRGGDDEPKAAYTIAPVSRGDIVQAVNTTGQLTPLVSVEVSSQISGLVTEVNVDFNSVVKKGQVLARIDPATYEQRVTQAQADLAAAEASETLVKLSAKRLKDLREKDLVTQADYEQIQAQLEQARASSLTRKAALQNARLDLDRCTLLSPIDGIVIFKQVEVGKTVVSSFSAPTLFVIAQDLARMRIIAPISEVDVWAVHPGQAVTFTVDAIPERTFNGRLTQIRNPYTPSEKQNTQSAQQSTITNFDGVIEVDNADLLLRPSLTANVSVVVSKTENALRIPNGALRVQIAPNPDAPHPPPLPAVAEESVDTSVVYRLPGGNRNATPEPVLVKLGITDNISTQVLGGLNEGDTVITGIPSRIEIPQRRGLF